LVSAVVDPGSGSSSTETGRLARLLGYLDHDPTNLGLIADAASAALDESSFACASDLLDRYRQIATLPAPLLNLEGLVFLRSGRLDEAAAAFDAIIAVGNHEPTVRFNRAWVHALHNEHADALVLLDRDTVEKVPHAAALKVRTLHHLGLIEEALAFGLGMTEQTPGDAALLGALSVAAMDADDLDLARHYAEKAEGGADAWTTRGLIALDEGNVADAEALFDAALTEHQDAPRAWLGKGLAMVAAGRLDDATEALTRGADLFETHLGSWIALGWTQLMAANRDGARATFERALAIDENFAESHGGLAVLDILEGQSDRGKRRADIALRLDRNCFGGMLARLLLQEAAGNSAEAARIWDRALKAEIGVNGKTLAQALLGLGIDPGRGRGGAA
jgi:tetratricopeptide (TPR) repeat protein